MSLEIIERCKRDRARASLAGRRLDYAIEPGAALRSTPGFPLPGLTARNSGVSLSRFLGQRGVSRAGNMQ